MRAAVARLREKADEPRQ